MTLTLFNRPLWTRKLGILLVVLAVASCTPISPSELDAPTTTPTGMTCGKLAVQQVNDLFGSYHPDDDLSGWIASQFGIGENEIEYVVSGPDTFEGIVPGFYWSVGSDEFSLAVTSDGYPLRFTQGWSPANRSIVSTLECLGEPEFYVADYRDGFEMAGPIVIVYAAYPETGTLFVFNLEASTSTDQLSLDRAKASDVFISVDNPKNSGRDWFDTIFGYRFGYGRTAEDEVRRKWYQDMLRPWPDAHSSLVYETVPGP